MDIKNKEFTKSSVGKAFSNAFTLLNPFCSYLYLTGDGSWSHITVLNNPYLEPQIGVGWLGGGLFPAALDPMLESIPGNGITHLAVGLRELQWPLLLDTFQFHPCHPNFSLSISHALRRGKGDASKPCG